MLHFITRNDRHILSDIQQIERMLLLVALAAGGNRPADFRVSERRQQLARARKQPRLSGSPGIRFAMQSLQALCFLLAYRPSRFAGEGAHDPPSAHADEAVNAPVGKL